MSLIKGPIYVIDYSGKQIIEDVTKERCSDKKKKTNKDTAVNGMG